MKSVARPRFRIADSMILIAACTIGFGLIGKEGSLTVASLIRDLRRYDSDPGFVAPNYTMFAWFQAQYLVASALPLVASLTMAFALIVLMPPRPGWRRLTRQPGAVACLIGSATLTLEVGTAALFYAFVRTGYTQPHGVWAYVLGLEGFRRVASRVSFAVGAAWLVLAIGGRWRAEPTWIDRAGRVVGMTWIVLIPLFNWSILR